MGFGYPAALGAKIANSNREVIVFDGDGSFLMNIQELATAAQHNIAVKAIIFNNEHLGLVSQFEDFFYRGQRGDTYIGRPGVDFTRVCQGFQIPARRISSLAELEEGIDNLLSAPGPFVLEVQVDYEDDVLPMIPGGGSVEDMITPDF
jgi:acetolactate synthase-1/2/3 large subunit